MNNSERLNILPLTEAENSNKKVATAKAYFKTICLGEFFITRLSDSSKQTVTIHNFN
jgi:hypothetical protein